MNVSNGPVPLGYLNALIIDPDSARRSRLKQAMRQVSQFERVISRAGLELGEDPMELLRGVDVVFLSNRLEQPVIEQFSKATKQDSVRGSTALVLIRSMSMTKAEVTAGYMRGIDGILLEPFSVEGVEQIAQIVDALKRADQEKRFARALRLLVQELGSQINYLAEMEREGRAARITRLALQEMSSVLHEFEGPRLARYFDVLCEIFSEIQAPDSTAVESADGSEDHSESAHREVARDAITQLKSVFAA